MAAERHEDRNIRWTTVAMASFATTALEQAVLEPGRSRAVALGVTIVLLIVPVIAAAWFFSRQANCNCRNEGASKRGRAARRGRSAAPVAPADALRFSPGMAGREPGRDGPVFNARADAAGGATKPRARSGRDGAPAGVCPALGAGESVPRHGGLAGWRRGWVRGARAGWRLRLGRDALAVARLLEWARLRVGCRGRFATVSALWSGLGAGRGCRGRNSRRLRTSASRHRARRPDADFWWDRLERPRSPIRSRRRRQRGERKRAPRVGGFHRERHLSRDRPAKSLRRV